MLNKKRSKTKRPPFFKSGNSASPPHSAVGSSSPSSHSLEAEVSGLKSEIRKERSIRAMDSITGPMKKAFPSGIRYPDDMVRNRHLYVGGKGKARL